MGTSRSKPPARPGSPRVPSWSDKDPPPDGNPQPAPPPPKLPPDGQPIPPLPDLLEPRRLTGFRRALKEYYSSGDRDDAKRALGHYSRGAAGGGGTSGQRIARAARVGGAAIGALSNAAQGNLVSPNGFDLSTLRGQSLTDAVATIVDAFCPPGIFDEDLLRAAIGEALAEALEGNDPFDPTSIDAEAAVIATRALIAELVFRQVMTEQGQAAENIPPLQAVARENDFRSLVREVTDVHATPELAKARGSLSQNQIAAIVRSVVTIVMEEASEW